MTSRKEKEVWKACDALKKSDTKLTYKAIGEQLIKMKCNRGSNSDIHRYLTTWKEGQSNKKKQSSKNALVKSVKTEISTVTEEAITLLKSEYKKLLPSSNKTNDNIKILMKDLVAMQEKSTIKLFQHYQNQLEHYLASLDRLKKTNQLLKEQIQQLKQTHQNEVDALQRQLPFNKHRQKSSSKA